MEAASNRLCFRGQRWVDVLSKDEIAVELVREGQAKQQHRLLSCLRSSDREGDNKKVRWADLSWLTVRLVVPVSAYRPMVVTMRRCRTFAMTTMSLLTSGSRYLQPQWLLW